MKFIRLYVVVFCCFCLFVVVKAQDTTTIVKNNLIINGVGVSFSSLFSEPLDFPSEFDNIKGQMAWSMGVTNTLVLSEKSNIFLLSELGYLSNQYIIEDIPNSNSIIDEQGNVNFTNKTYFDIMRKYNYVYFSTSIGKSVLKLSHKTFLFGTAGFRLNYLYRSALFSERLPENEKIDFTFSKSDIEQNFTTSIIASVGIFYKPSQNFSIILSPQFAYDLNKIVINNTINQEETRFINGGFSLSALYNF